MPSNYKVRGQTSGIERRSMSIDGAELRASASGDTLTFTGYASVTESPYEMEDFLGSYTETVHRGAFKKTLSEGADVSFLVNHGGMTLARTKSSTLRLSEDSTGLHVEAELDPGNSHVRDLQSAMSRHDMDEMSFAFRVTRQEWSPDYTQRDITEVNLSKGDVSLVNYGANPHTSGLTSLRALDPDQIEALQRVLHLVAAADGAVDVAQPLLAEVLGVENPDLDEPKQEHEGHSLAYYAARARLLDI
jgi:HK97 family phage prohead protease